MINSNNDRLETLHKLLVPSMTPHINKAFTHSSCCHEVGGNKFNNERLEWLGDSILNNVVAHELFKQDKLAEGQLTALRADPRFKTNPLSKEKAKEILDFLLNKNAMAILAVQITVG